MSAWILGLALKATLLLLGVGAIAAFARRHAAATRHFVWASGFALLLLLPVLALMLPGWSPRWVGEWAPQVLLLQQSERAPRPSPIDSVEADGSDEAGKQTATGAIAEAPGNEPRRATATAAQGPVAAGTAPTSGGFAAGLIGAWLVGTLAMAAWLGVGMIRRTRLSRAATHLRQDPVVDAARDAARLLGLHRSVRVLMSASRFVPMTWGVARPVLYLPADARRWEPQRLRAVLLHELAHVKRNDSFCRALAQLACCVFWFHPLAWLAARRMLCEQERACDDAVILAGADPHDYAATLLQMAREFRAPRPLVVGALAFARRSNLEHRLLSILDPLGRRNKMSTLRKAVVAGLLAVAVVPLAVLSPVAAQQEAEAQIRVQTSGLIRIGDDVDSVVLGPGGSMTLTQGDRELVIRTGDSGELVFQYSVAGTQRPFDDDARRWANETLEDIGDSGRPFVEPLELELIESLAVEPLELERLIEPVEVILPQLRVERVFEPVEVVLPPLEVRRIEPVDVVLPPLEVRRIEPVEVIPPPLRVERVFEPVEVEVRRIEPVEVTLPQLEVRRIEPQELTLRPLDVRLIEPVEVTLPPLEVQLIEPREVTLPSLEAVLIEPQLPRFRRAGWISISVDGEERVGLVPRSEPYADGGPRVGLPVEAPSDVVDMEGRPVQALDIIAWREGDEVRLTVYGQAALGSATDARKLLGSMLVGWSSQTELTLLTELGIEGITVTTGPAPRR